MLQEELDADAYGYKVLIGMIEAQKQKRMPTEIGIFYEDYYLSPIMLFEYYCTSLAGLPELEENEQKK